MNAALHAPSQGEHDAALAVVGAGAVVLGDAPPELAESHDDDFIRQALLFQVGLKGAEAPGQRGQQFVLLGALPGVRVEAAQGHVQHALSHPGGDQAGRVAQLPGKLRVGVSCAVPVLPDVRLHPRGVLHHLAGGAAQVIGLALTRGVQHGVEGPLQPLRKFHLEAVQRVDAGQAELGRLKGLRGGAAHVTGAEGVTDLLRDPANPAVRLCLRGVGRVPDRHAGELTAVGVGVTDVLHPGQLPVIPQFHQGFQAGVHPQVGRQRQHLFFRNGDPGPGRVVSAVAVRHQCVQAVVAAGELNHHQRLLTARLRRRPRQEARHTGRGRHRNGGKFKKITSCWGHGEPPVRRGRRAGGRGLTFSSSCPVLSALCSLPSASLTPVEIQG